MIRLKVAASDREDLKRLVFAALPSEAGAFALAGVSNHRAGTDILIRRPVAVPQALFRVQREERLEVAPSAINGLASLCEANRLGAVICHSHPTAAPYSPSDDFGEKRLFDSLLQFLPAGAPLASLLFYPNGCRGRVWEPARRRFMPIGEVVAIGRRIDRITHNDAAGDELQPSAEIYDRQVRAFGEDGQRRISRAKVGIIGVGGTGSAVAEQLARLGVNDFLLIDPDVFSPSNLTRMYGTFGKVKAPTWWPWRRKRGNQFKVDLVTAHLTNIRPDIRVLAVPETVILRSAAEQLRDRDVIFLCTDEHWGRSVVNEIAYQYMIPTMKLGMSVRAENQTITAAAAGVDVLRPDHPCLWCSQFLSSARVAEESLPPGERASRAQDGYVEGVGTPAPSVVSVNTTVAGLAVTQFLQLLTDFMGETGDVEKLRYNVLTGEVRRGRCKVTTGCICAKVKGFGDLRRLSTLDDAPAVR